MNRTKEEKPSVEVNIGPRTWVEMLPTLVLLIEIGDPKGKSHAMDELRRMAQVADLYSKAKALNLRAK